MRDAVKWIADIAVKSTQGKKGKRNVIMDYLKVALHIIKFNFTRSHLKIRLY